MEKLDAVVVGGGPAGAAVAIAMATAGRSVALLDRSAPPDPRSGDVLVPEIRPELEQLGLWDRFRVGDHVPSPGVVTAWGNENAVSQDYIWNPYGHGWHVDRRAFRDMLLAAAQEAGAVVHRSTRATRATGTLDRRHPWQVDAVADGVGDGHAIRLDAAFLIEASGRGSLLSRSPAAKRAVYDRLVAVVATVRRSDGDGWVDDRMLLEATENGWWYSAPVPGPGLVVAWMTDPGRTHGSAGRLPDLWRHELDRVPHTRRRMPSMPVARVGVVAANSWCRRAAHGHWLAVGDAAAAYDPLSGQGVIRALETGRSAAAAVIAAQAGASQAVDDYADAVTSSFRRYLRLRWAHYSAERRWPGSPFWRRRQADPELLAPPP